MGEGKGVFDINKLYFLYCLLDINKMTLSKISENLTHSSQDKQFSLLIQRLDVDLELNCGFLFFAPWALMG